MKPSVHVVGKAIAGIALLATLGVASGTANAKTLQERFDEADAQGGDWYKNNPNGMPWGQSYVLMSYVDAFNATHDPKYLDRLAYGIDNALAVTDKARGLKDFRNESKLCWQSTGYSTQPVCWAAHTGMLTSSMAEFALILKNAPTLASHQTYDGTTLGDKAATFLAAAREGVTVHEVEWRSDATTGWYVFPPDATFYQYNGQEVPPNMYGAMGLLYIALYEATGEDLYKDRATRLAKRFRKRLTTSATTGAYLWNYWNPGFNSPGEDLPHAALNMNFVMRAEKAGIEFTRDDVAKLVKTYLLHTTVDSATVNSHIAGGQKMAYPKSLDVGFLATVSSYDPIAHATVRNAFEPQRLDGVGGIRALRGLGSLMVSELPIVKSALYHADWTDLGDGRKQASAADANILSYPDDPTKPHIIKFKYSSTKPVKVQQYDGANWHTLHTLAPTSGKMVTTIVGYRPELYSSYEGGVLFQFSDAFVAGQGIIVQTMDVDPDEKADGDDGDDDGESMSEADAGGCSTSANSSRALTSAVILVFALISIVTMRRSRKDP
ncbi:MAG: hypothetical protein AB7O24_23255 [Kofleriaceae bacterium]